MNDESKMLYAKISDVVSCVLCQELLDDPVECVECKYTVCRNCWMQQPQTNESQVEKDDAKSTAKVKNNNSQSKTVDHRSNNVDVCSSCSSRKGCRVSRSMLRFLDKLRFKCRNRALGCEVESVYSNYKQHVYSCQPLEYADLNKM